jgi:uncharacterized membrane protein
MSRQQARAELACACLFVRPLPTITYRSLQMDGGYAVFVKLAQFLEIMLYVLVAGVMWGTWLSLGRTMTRYDAATFLADGKHMIANLGTAMAVLMIAAIVAGLLVVVALFRYRSTTAAWLALAGLLLMVAVLAVTLSVEVPIGPCHRAGHLRPPRLQDPRIRQACPDLRHHRRRASDCVAGIAGVVQRRCADLAWPPAVHGLDHQRGRQRDPGAWFTVPGADPPGRHDPGLRLGVC